MPQNISEAQLIAYKTQIATGGVEAVRQVYRELYNNGNGYKYAGWALGVATGDTITGQSAQRSIPGCAHITSVGANGALGTWRAIGLDLNGDGIQTVSQQSSGVVFDVDGNACNIVYTAVSFAQSAVNDIAWEIYA